MVENFVFVNMFLFRESYIVAMIFFFRPESVCTLKAAKSNQVSLSSYHENMQRTRTSG